MHRMPRSVCVVLGMYPLEEVSEVIEPNICSIVKTCMGKSGAKGNPWVRARVQPMDQATTVALFVKSVQTEYPRVKRLDAASQKKMFQQTEGNPLFIHEIAVEIMAAQKRNTALMQFSADGGTLSLDKMEPKDLLLPPALELKLGILVDHQHLAAQLILKIIAVAGRPLSFAEVYHCFPLDHHLCELPDEFEHLMEQELIHDLNQIPPLGEHEDDVNGERMKKLSFWYTTEFLHHTIDNRLLFEHQKPLEKLLLGLAKKDLTIPEHVFEDHSCSTEMGTSWGAEEIWRKQSAKRERARRASEVEMKESTKSST